uniref:Uncharacterized protein n=1 Tax=Pseudourostyla cristata TaxID=293816 RepID=A0A4P9JLG4_9SPIT|nr:hypothetical protein [Pseudourostyla cristata]
MLPPSTLFKNRLFVERDSKNHRIFNNIGLTFRNSKWSDHATYNIKNIFKIKFNDFTTKIITFIIFLFLIKYSSFYYVCEYIFNDVYYMFWCGFDAFHYYFVFGAWFMLMFYSFMLNTVYSYFFFNSFSHTKRNFPRYSNFKKKTLVPAAQKTRIKNSFKIAKADQKWLILMWLNRYNWKKDDVKMYEMRMLFSNPNNLKTWAVFFNTYFKLYNLNYFCITNLKKTSNFQLLSYNRDFINHMNMFYFHNYKNKLMMFSLYNNFILWKVLHHKTKPYLSENLTRLNTFDLIEYGRYNLYNVNKNFNTNLTQISILNNQFYLNNVNFNQLNWNLYKFNELMFLNNNIEMQITNAKLFRWLYKYSIIHRKSFKNIHKMTLFKNNLNAGCYDTNILNKNIWLATFFNKHDNLNIYKLTSNLYFKNLINVNQNNVLESVINNFNHQNFKLLNTYETSFFWFLKRYYIYNTLNANYVTSNVINKSNEIQNSNNYELLNYFTITDLLSRSLSLNLLNLQVIISKDMSESLLTQLNVNKQDVAGVNIKDLMLIFNDKTLFNKDDMAILYWILSPITYQNNNKTNLVYFNSLNYFSINELNLNAKFITNRILTNDDELMVYSDTSLNAIYLTDLILLLTL